MYNMIQQSKLHNLNYPCSRSLTRWFWTAVVSRETKVLPNRKPRPGLAAAQPCPAPLCCLLLWRGARPPHPGSAALFVRARLHPARSADGSRGCLGSTFGGGLWVQGARRRCWELQSPRCPSRGGADGEPAQTPFQPPSLGARQAALSAEESGCWRLPGAGLGARGAMRTPRVPS